jgi:hypothetical protein
VLALEVALEVPEDRERSLARSYAAILSHTNGGRYDATGDHARRAALESFRSPGARPWERRAEGELRAPGETARKRDPSTLDELTPQELQISALVDSAVRMGLHGSATSRSRRSVPDNGTLGHADWASVPQSAL